MSVKSTLNSIKDSVDFGWTGTTDTISELIDLLRDDSDKVIDQQKLNSLFLGTKNKNSISFYYSFVVNKLNSLFPQYKTDVPILYNTQMHFKYMKNVLADYLSNSAYSDKKFSDIDDEQFEDINIDFNNFLNGTTSKAPENFDTSWNKLIDLLAKGDVNLGSANNSIEENLKNARVDSLGESSKSLGSFLETATEEQKRIFKKNFEQDLLIADFRYFAGFRSILRFFELFDGHKDNGSLNATGEAIKKMFENSAITAADFKSVESHTGLPYGGRICPIVFLNNKINVNNLKTHPFSWMFFRDITDVKHVKSKLAFFKMIYRDGKQYEVPLPIKLPKKISADGEEEPIERAEEVIRSKCEINKDYSDLQNVRLEDINISFKGTTPTTAQNDVDVSITLHLPRIASLKEKFKEPIVIDGKEDNYDWKILDFITYYGNSDLRSEQDLGFIQNVKYSGINSRLILKVGYDDSAMPNQILKDLLKNSPMVLDLSVIDHTIAKDPVKPFAKLTIKYAGHIMKMFNSPMTDVLGADKLEKRVERQKIISLAQEQNCQPRIVEELFNFNRQLNKAENNDLGQNLISSLYKRKKVFKTPFSPSMVLQNAAVLGESVYFNTSFYTAFRNSLDLHVQWDNILGETDSGGENFALSIIDRAEGGGTESFFVQDVYWTTIGDVIDVAMDSIYEFDGLEGANKHTTIGGIRKLEKMKDFFKFNKMKVITTNLKGYNIADYPVSLTYLQEWIKEEIIDQEFDFYPLMSFIKQLIQACITNPLNKNSDLETPVLVSVDSDLGLPSGDPTRNQAFLNAGVTNIELFWKNRLKAAGKINFSETPYESSLNSFKKEITKDGNPYKAACGRNKEIDEKIFKEYESKDNNYNTPIIKKLYKSSRQDYYNYIYCHAIESKLDKILPTINNESECIAYGIPVIRLPDYKYTLIEKTVSAETETESDIPANTGGGLAELSGDGAVLKKNKSKSRKRKKNITKVIPKTTQQLEGDAFNNIVVKSLKFTKKDDDYLREARYSSQHFGLFAQLSSVYSATVELEVVCTFLTPGMLVYLDADTGDTIFQEGSLANALGLGGMHIITSVQHKAVFENNELKGFTTTFDALYCYKGSSIKVTPKKDTTTIKKENKTKEKLCENLFKVIRDSSNNEDSFTPDITTDQALAAFPSISATSTTTDVITYYKQNKIKLVYKEIHEKKKNVKITEIEFVDTWRPDNSDPIKQKMYKVTVDSESYHINFLGDKIDGE